MRLHWRFFIILAVLVSLTWAEDPPKITLAPKNQRVAEEKIVSFFCKASGNPGPSFSWRKGSRRISINRNRLVIKEMPHGSVLRIEPVKKKDAGSYYCIADNGIGAKAKANATLEVFSKIEINHWKFMYEGMPEGYPRITDHPSLKAVEKDRNTILQCHAKGEPKPSIIWLRDFIPVDLSNPRLTLLEGGELQIERSQESDVGKYECVAENEHGVDYSYAANLYVKVRRVPPHFTMPPESVEVQPATDVNLTCVAVGSPMPEVRWRQGNRELTDENEIPIGRNVLELKNVLETKNYTCVASSDLGIIEEIAQVKVTAQRNKTPGTAPRNLRGRAASATTISLEWQEPEIPNGIIEGYKIFYTLNPDLPIILWDHKTHNNGQNKVETLLNLKTNSTYTITILAFSSAGEGPLSEEIQVMTNPGVPVNKPVIFDQSVPQQPKNLQALAESANTVHVTWDRPDAMDNIESYELYYNDSHYRQNVHISIKPPVVSYRLVDLTPDTVYHVQVSAKSLRGEGARTPTIQVRTPQFAPGAPPLAVSGIALDSRRLNITWKPPPRTKQNGDITGYKIMYVENDGVKTKNDALVVNVDADVNSYILTDLSKWTQYKIWLLAYTSIGESPSSQPILVSTEEDVPGEPRKIRAEPINSTAVFIEWKHPSSKNRNGIIRGYQIQYVEVDDHDQQSGDLRMTDTTDGDKTEYVITNLEPDTRYQFTVAAYTRKGDGIRSRAKIVETKGAVPTPPRNLEIELTQENPPQVKVSWQRPREVFGTLHGFKVTWGRVGERYEEHILRPDTYVFLTTFLDKGATYEFRVAARNQVDYGERAVDTIKTPDGAPAGAPQNFTVIPVSETTVLLTWDQPAKNLRNGEIKMYQINFHKQSDSINVEDLNVTDTSLDISGLDMNTDYVFLIRGYTSKGPGPWSNKQIAHTFGHMPPTPENVKIRRTSPTTVDVMWDEPAFPVAGYKVYYNMFALPNMDLWQNIDVGPYTVAEITGLDPQTIYVVRVQAISTGRRAGNFSAPVYTNMIPKDRPDAVQNFRVALKSSRIIQLAWDHPEKQVVNSYTLTFEGSKSYWEKGTLKTIYSPLVSRQIGGQESSWQVENLQPKMKYDFNISALFRDGTTGPDQYLTTETLIEPPSYVDVPVIKSYGSGTVELGLYRASEKHGPLSHYLLIVVPEQYPEKAPEDFEVEELEDDGPVDMPSLNPYIAARFEANSLPDVLKLGNKQMYDSHTNRPLDPDHTYRVFLRAYSVDPKLYTSSEYSASFQIKTDGFKRNGVGTDLPNPRPTMDDARNLLLIVAPVCGAVGLLIIVCILVVIYFKRKSNRKEKVDEQTKPPVEVCPHPSDPVEMRRQHYQTPAMISHPPIPVHMLAEHIENLKASDNLRFSQEYESIEPGQQFTWDNSNLEVNKPKNRYANVIAYDHSRVILQPIEGLPGSDYINANYMDGYRKQNAYIATQGPLPETFGDFWRMVWEQRSSTIVMMTKLEERSRIKCDQYWPSRGPETYGLMQVTLQDVTELATYTIRTFYVAKYGCAEKREVRQFQFTAWPDHGVPDHPTPLLMFMRRVKASNPLDAGPMIAHCSAGVGRTGAFIVIDSMLERIKHEKTVDIYGHVTCLRAQRNYMVQTEDQYIFIHDALLEAVTCGNTEVPARNLGAHIQKLSQPDPGETVTGMELEFKRLANVKANPNRFVSANLPVNKFKNRLVNILPYESTRVCLQPIRGVDGSDYINASFIDGYRYKKAYIATQGPLVETTEDFWRMLWEHNSTIIVMLTKLREMGREKCHQYWPSERSARYQYFVVDPMAEYNMPQYILREFKVTDARDGQSRTVRQFQFTDWPEQGVPKSGEGFIDFIGQVHKTKEQFGQDGPITVHCSAGVGRTGGFITLSIVLERMRYEGVVDMFQTVKMLRTQRPAMVQTEDQYQFCYRAALEYLGSFDHYAN
ncbi:receptor-type tyrosine-protein phosphatase F isoform X7 [Octopus sinensis]|uniref:protein-tyrosine-phosphatase n=1 Tax=Octopus sinensis TaxID=2607531 RepID=A0A7E6F2C9_9MOLL|nr:receptor-type tyrosine-protein phosphatase F isoform X7 [Octopus sinensis]